MKVQPTREDLANWSRCVPDGDLLFFGERAKKLSDRLPYPSVPRAQTKKIGIDGPWTLNARSWYGYALNQADHSVWIPAGMVEQLPESLMHELRAEQIRLNVPTVFDDRWLTARAWSEISAEGRMEVMLDWMIRNEVHTYESFAFEDLAEEAKTHLVNTGLRDKLNAFATSSGPNCFAAAAACVHEDKRKALCWMHYPEFEQTAVGLGFKAPVNARPEATDILTFTRRGEPVHAAFYLGHGIYFEKAGQDFYEPYRLERFEAWPVSWPDCELQVWRR